MLPVQNGPIVIQQKAIVAPHLLMEDDTYPPNLQEWIKYLKEGGDPKVQVWNYSLLHYFLIFFSWETFDDEIDQFSLLVDLLLRLGADPNEKMPKFSINNNAFSNVSALHIVYIFWKSHKWNAEKELLLEQLFDRILEDPRTDVRQVFSMESSDLKPDWDSNRTFDSDFHVSLRNLLEEANLLHYASLIGDMVTVNKLLSRDPDLIHSECSTVAGKNLLSYKELQQIDRTKKGVIAYGSSHIKDFAVCDVERVKNVTALHIAAREIQNLVCGFLIGRHAFRGAVDSSGASARDYVLRAYRGWSDCGGYGTNLVKFKMNISQVKQLHKTLEYTPPAPRTLPQAHCMVHKQNYSILYDTRTKVAIYVYECLKKENLIKEASRGNIGFTQDQEVPPINRAKNTDYTHTGYHKGHMRAAANAVQTAQDMRETFKLTNAFPENPSLNLGYWKQLENKVRNLVMNNQCVEVFTGCLFLPANYQDGKKRVVYEVIGNGNVAVPTHAYKVLYVHEQGKKEELAYLLPNVTLNPGMSLESFRDTVENIQRLSGVLFKGMI